MSDGSLMRHLAAVVDSSADAIVSQDLNGTVLSWNRAAERLFGYPADEIVGRSIRVLIPPDRLHQEESELAQIRKGVPIPPFETERMHRDGHLVPVTVSVSPVLGADGAVIGGAKIARSLSDRIRSEQELRASHQRLIALVAASRIFTEAPDVADVWRKTVTLAHQVLAADAYAVWRLEPPDAWKVVYAQGLSAEFTQRVIDAGGVHSSRAPRVLTGPVVVEDIAALAMPPGLQDAYRQEDIRSMAIFPLVLDGRAGGTLVFYFRGVRTLSDLEKQTGEALANLAAAAITTAELQAAQRRAAERAAQAEHHAEFLSRATYLLNTSLDYEQTLSAVTSLAVPEIADWCAVDMRDANGDLQRLAVAHVDPAKIELARRLQTEYPADPKTAGGVHQVLRTGEPAMMSRIPQELMERAARSAEHLQVIRALSLTSYMCVPLIIRRGVIGAITFVSAESGREYVADDLEFAKEVGIRASLAVENALAYREAKDASRLKDEFLATLSHEIRTPLNAIMGYARMMDEGSIPEERRSRALAVVGRNAESLHRLVEDVFDVARMASGKLTLTPAMVSVADILNQALSTVAPAAQAKGVRIQLAVDATRASVKGDADRLQQVFWNLLSNAVKFTPNGGQVSVGIREEGEAVVVTVRDTGRGITPDFLPHVFERFRQEHGHTTRVSGGLGLGLSIVKDLVELHGGQVHVESDGPETGATFTVSLPAWNEEATESRTVRVTG